MALSERWNEDDDQRHGGDNPDYDRSQVGAPREARISKRPQHGPDRIELLRRHVGALAARAAEKEGSYEP